MNSENKEKQHSNLLNLTTICWRFVWSQSSQFIIIHLDIYIILDVYIGVEPLSLERFDSMFACFGGLMVGREEAELLDVF